MNMSGPILANSTTAKQAPASPKKRAAIYLRVSTEEQSEGFSLPTQLETCRTLAAQYDYSVPMDYIIQDEKSGTTLDRPGLRRLRELVHARAIAVVIVHDVDRLSRTLGHQLLLSEELEQHGIQLLVHTHAIDKSAEGLLFFQLRGAVAEFERAKILERLARGKKGRAQAGHTEGGMVPLGYRYVGGHKSGHYEIDHEEAALVERIFHMCLSGMATQAIARLLSHERVPTQQDRRGQRNKHLARCIWNRSSIHKILRNETYTGTMYHNKTQRVAGRKDPSRKTNRITRDMSEWVSVSVPVIIAPEIFHAVQLQLQQNAAQATRNRKHEYLFLGGRLRCGRCGTAMTGKVDSSGTRRYRCARPRWQITEDDQPFCTGSAKAETLETQVWEAVERVLRDPNLIRAEIERQHGDIEARHAAIARERQVITTALARCDRDQARWDAAYEGEVIDLADFKMKKAEIDARRASLDAEHQRLNQEAQALDHAHCDAAALAGYCAQVQANLSALDMPNKRKALEALDIRIHWTPGEIPQIQGSITIPTEQAIASLALQ
jgi:site-specific DNA recombinase